MSKSILVLEENSVVHGLVASALEMDGVTIHHEFNPENYVERARALSPDLVLISNADQRSGYEVCRALKAGANGDAVPLVLLANSRDALDAGELQRLQVDGVIRKPFEASDLQQQVSKHLNLIDLIGSAYEFKKSQSLAEEGLNPLDKMEVLDPEILGLLHEEEGGAGPVPEVDFSEELQGEPPPTLVMDEEAFAETLRGDSAFEPVSPQEPQPDDRAPVEEQPTDEGEGLSGAPLPFLEDEAGLDELGAADLLEEDAPEELAYAPAGFDQFLDEPGPEGAAEEQGLALDQVEVELEEEELDLSALDEDATGDAVEPAPPPGGLNLPPALRRMMEMKPVFTRETEAEPAAPEAAAQENPEGAEGDLQTLTAFDLGDEFDEEDLPPLEVSEEDLPPLEISEEDLPPLDAAAAEDLPPLDAAAEDLPSLEISEEDLPPLDAAEAGGYGLEDEELDALPPLEPGDMEPEEEREAVAALAEGADYGMEDETLDTLPDLEEDTAPPAWEEGEEAFAEGFVGEEDVDEARVLRTLQKEAESAVGEETGGFDDTFSDDEDDRLAALEALDLEGEEAVPGIGEEELALEDDEESQLLASLGDDDFSAETFDYDEMRPTVDAVAQPEGAATTESLAEQQDEAVALESRAELRGLEEDSSGYVAEAEQDDVAEMAEEDEEEEWEGSMAAEILAEEAMATMDALIADEDAAAGFAVKLEAGDLSEELTDVELEEIEDLRSDADLTDPTFRAEEPESAEEPVQMAAPDEETLAALSDDTDLTDPAFRAGEPEPLEEEDLAEITIEFGPLPDGPETGTGELEDEEVPPVEAMMGAQGRVPAEDDDRALGFTGGDEDEEEVPPGMELSLDEVDTFAAGIEQDFGDVALGEEHLGSEDELVGEMIDEAEADAFSLDDDEELDLDVTGALGSSFEDEFAALRSEIEANPEGERLDNILREEEVQHAADDLEFDIPQHENTFTRAMGITDLPGFDPREEAGVPAEAAQADGAGAEPDLAESPLQQEPWLDSPAPAGSLLDQGERARLSDLLDEIITVSVRKAVQEEMPRLMERLMRDNPTA